ncbi:hypothetical protein CB1_000880029 [Camelus ferus]|nr:hypothetical protein CB1_000880029 [Camelus ferus]
MLTVPLSGDVLGDPETPRGGQQVRKVMLCRVLGEQVSSPGKINSWCCWLSYTHWSTAFHGRDVTQTYDPYTRKTKPTCKARRTAHHGPLISKDPEVQPLHCTAQLCPGEGDVAYTRTPTRDVAPRRLVGEHRRIFPLSENLTQRGDFPESQLKRIQNRPLSKTEDWLILEKPHTPARFRQTKSHQPVMTPRGSSLHSALLRNAARVDIVAPLAPGASTARVVASSPATAATATVGLQRSGEMHAGRPVDAQGPRRRQDREESCWSPE